jgi:hypothetical protein
VIKSIQGYENGTVEILDIKDFKNLRIAGFLYNNYPAYIEFTKNSGGNYEWRHIQREGDSFASFPINIGNGTATLVKFMIITNRDNEIAKLELGVNGQVISEGFKMHQNSVTWIDLPKAKDHSYTFTYKYFDNNGNPIK